MDYIVYDQLASSFFFNFVFNHQDQNYSNDYTQEVVGKISQ
jgi:hypothetical protein